jgi:hypothetical protein
LYGDFIPSKAQLLDWLEEENPGLAKRTEAPLPGDVLDVASGSVTRDAGMHSSFDWSDLRPTSRSTRRAARRRSSQY